MPLFEVETDAHIVLILAEDEDTARVQTKEHFPLDRVRRVARRPRDCWVISKAALGLTDVDNQICSVARDCLSASSGDKVQAIRLYMNRTGTDLEKARRAIESNMVMGW
jgi:hypothetical protein